MCWGKYIIDSCKLICSKFKNSRIYRVGGDEFVAILENEDYLNRDKLIEDFNKLMDVNMRNNQDSIA